MKIKGVVCVLLSAVFVSAFSVTAFAAGSSVIYDGSARDFIVAPADTDLFQNFKDVYPGDVLTQQIEVKNSAASPHQVEIFMKAESVDPAYQQFLSQLRLNVTAGESTVFNAPADEQAGLADWVSLGTLSAGGSTILNATLTVPIELGNEYQKRKGETLWRFKVVELGAEPSPGPTTTPSPSPGLSAAPAPTAAPAAGIHSTPQTGDTNNPAPYIVLLLGSFAAMVVLFLHGKRRKKAAPTMNTKTM